MPAYVTVHGADVETRAAAHAAHHGLELRVEEVVSTVVHDDVVDLGRTIQLAIAARAGIHAEVRRHLGADRALGKQRHEDVEGLERGDDAVDADEDDLHRRERVDHASVTLVGDERHRPGFGHGHVAAAYAHLSVEELRAQHLAQEVRNVLGNVITVVAALR